MNNQAFTFNGKQYKISDLSEEQLALLRSILTAEQKIMTLQSELTVLQAGKSSIMETFQKIADTLTPVTQEG